MLEVSNLYKSYEGALLLRGISFTVAVGETVCLLGPSGSGKSTLLRIIAGLEAAAQGQVCWEGEDLASVPAHRRGFGLVFQDYALFPHMDVGENVAFGLKMQGLTSAETELRVNSVLGKVNLTEFKHRRVADLSGGEQQRVALARALAPKPHLLMFDEPLGALDRSLRERLMGELRDILRTSGVPAIYVTHDQEEAFKLADRILLLHDGEIVREGRPAEIWAEPGSAWVARFLDVGNILEGSVRSDGGVETTVGIFSGTCRHNHHAGDKVSLLVRPSGVRKATDGRYSNALIGTGKATLLNGVVADVVFHQDQFKVTLANHLYFYLPEAPIIGEEITLQLSTTGIQCLS
jgi:ABC-type Fe3+/spermidine/putrescine transport system ATPase subunit